MLFIFAILLAVQTPSPSADPYEVYKAAIHHLSQLPQPQYIDETDHWIAYTSTRGMVSQNEWDQRGLYRAEDRRENILTVPYSRTAAAIVGESYFAPDEWLISHTAHPAETPHGTFTPDLSDLKIIASAVAVAKPSYDVTLKGIEALTNGGHAYHLVLRPRGDPMKHNIRELWINTDTMNIVEAVLVGMYRPSYHDVLEETTVSEDFGSVGPYWVVIHHHWTYGSGFDARRFEYDSTTKAMSFPSFIPDWYFDASQFAAHRNDVNTTSVWNTDVTSN